MTQTEKFVKLTLPHIVALVKAQENLKKCIIYWINIKVQAFIVIGKEKQMIDLLDNFQNKSLYCALFKISWMNSFFAAVYFFRSSLYLSEMFFFKSSYCFTLSG